MITNAFINAAYYTLQFISNLFPYSTGFSTSIQTSFTTIGSYTKTLSDILPIEATMICLVLWIVLEALIFTFKNMNWISSYIPVIGGKGN
jgi:hypothetical protein